MNGKFKVKNRSKYKGDPTEVYWRSSWELSFMMKLDMSSDVVAWSSECVVVPYSDPSTGRFRRYFPDFFVEKANGEKYLIEIKPFSQTQSPIKGNKKERTFLNEVATYVTNTAKWESAKRYCEKRGWSFVVLTEKELKLW